MKHSGARRLLALLVVAGASLTPAQATFHLMVVQEVFPGTPANPNAQYVMLRMTGSGQNFVLNTFLEVQDAAGNVMGRFGTFDHNVAAGGTLGCSYPSCPAIVVGTSAARALFGFSFDQIVDAQAGRVPLPLAGGRVCFRSSSGGVDCVAWGSFTGANTIPGLAQNGCDMSLGAPSTALSPGFALTRRQFNCVSNENSLDFENRFPHPVANNGASANIDIDADGLIGALDCDDGDATSYYFPVEVTGGAVSSPPTVVMWDPQDGTSGTSSRYDAVTGRLADLLSSRGYTGASCLGSDVNGVSLADPSPDPAPGEGLYYLVRAGNKCGKGTWGDSSLMPDPRDFLDVPGDVPCP